MYEKCSAKKVENFVLFRPPLLKWKLQNYKPQLWDEDEKVFHQNWNIYFNAGMIDAKLSRKDHMNRETLIKFTLNSIKQAACDWVQQNPLPHCYYFNIKLVFLLGPGAFCLHCSFPWRNLSNVKQLVNVHQKTKVASQSQAMPL